MTHSIGSFYPERTWGRREVCFGKRVADAIDKLAVIRDIPDNIPDPLLRLMFEHYSLPGSLESIIKEAILDSDERKDLKLREV